MKNDGVSNVIGVILILGILSLFMVTVRLDWVPEWQEDKEAQMSEDVENQLSAMASGIQQGPSTPVTYPIDLSRPTSFWVPVQLPATLSFEAAAGGGNLDMELQELTRNGKFAAGINPDWAPLTTATMEELAWMRMHLDTAGGGNGNVIIEFRDDSGLLGSIDVDRQGGLKISLMSASGQVIDTEFVSNTGGPSEYIFDLLEDIDTSSILQNLDGPLQLDIIQNDLGATFAWAFIDSETVSSNSGPEYTWQPSFTSGRLSTDLNHGEFEDQTFAIENGAVILSQADGSAVRIAAGLQIAPASIGFQWASLTGDSQTSSESRTLGVELSLLNQKSLKGLTDSLTYQFQTNNPRAWAAQWNQQFEAAGIPVSQYSITTTATQVELTYEGPLSDATKEITVSWTQRTYNVEISR